MNSSSLARPGHTWTAVRAVTGKRHSDRRVRAGDAGRCDRRPGQGRHRLAIFSSMIGRITSRASVVQADAIANFPDPSVTGTGLSPGTWPTSMATATSTLETSDLHGRAAGRIRLIRGTTTSSEVGPAHAHITGDSIFAVMPDGSSAEPTAIPNGFHYYLGEAPVSGRSTDVSLSADMAANWTFRPHRAVPMGGSGL